jgi:hypothetical protein
MADAVLHVKVDPSGAVAGSTAAAVSLDKLSAAAARSNAATNMLTSAFTSSNVAARNVEVGLRSMLREQTGLARAYAAGSDAVKQYNMQLKIESVLAEVGAWVVARRLGCAPRCHDGARKYLEGYWGRIPDRDEARIWVEREVAKAADFIVGHHSKGGWKRERGGEVPAVQATPMKERAGLKLHSASNPSVRQAFSYLWKEILKGA